VTRSSASRSTREDAAALAADRRRRRRRRDEAAEPALAAAARGLPGLAIPVAIVVASDDVLDLLGGVVPRVDAAGLDARLARSTSRAASTACRR
jgi:hypothetical protein